MRVVGEKGVGLLCGWSVLRGWFFFFGGAGGRVFVLGMLGKVELNESRLLEDEEESGRFRRRSVSRFQGRDGWLFRLRSGGCDVPFLILLAVLMVTAVFFVGIRHKGVELSIEQMAELERRVNVFANSTVYVYEVQKPENLLSTFAPEDWAQVAKDVDYVAFVYDDIYEFMTEQWISTAQKSLDQSPIPGFGIALFDCGCIVPSVYFENVAIRFNGAECILLPGFIFEKEFVFWVESKLDIPCKRRSQVLGTKYIETHSQDLETVQEHFAELLQIMQLQYRDSLDRRIGRRKSIKNYKKLHYGVS